MVSNPFEDFLSELLATESGIDPARFDWYMSHYAMAVVRTPRVEAPGRVVRDEATGAPLLDTVTVAAYFDRLGVGALFDRRDPDCITRMQYGCVNAFGFVGYQFGEAMLIDTGYYRAARVWHEGAERDMYYVGSVETSAWRERRREVLHRLPGTTTDVVATDVNRWLGTFTGKDGVASLADLRQPAQQERVIRSELRHNYRCIAAALAKYQEPVSDALHRSGATLSGVLAAAHLCGPFAVAAYLATGANTADEAGTPLTSYLARFAGYCLPSALLAG
jgi:hypothetical protein